MPSFYDNPLLFSGEIDPLTGFPIDYQDLPWTVPQEPQIPQTPSYDTPTTVSSDPVGGGGNVNTDDSLTQPWTSLLPNVGSTNIIEGDFTQAPIPWGMGGNYHQVQNSIQDGQFGTAGQTDTTQSQISKQNTNQSSTGQQSSTVNTDQTTQAVDTLGFGQLLKDQATATGASDTQRNAFLRDVIATGGGNLNSQVDQAVRRSLTGPQMSGAGDSARARAAGYAGAEMGRNNLNQRLAASEQLAGPTGLTTLAGAANPYVGSKTTGTQQSLIDTFQNMASNSTGWQNLIGQTKEAQAGITNARSSQAGAGNIPEGQPVKSGGCVLCTAAIDLGLSNHRKVLRKVIHHKMKKDWPRFKNAARGYWAIFTPFARWLLSHPRIAKLLWPLAKMVVYEELRVSGRKLPLRVGAWLVHWIGHLGCAAVGKLPVQGYVSDPLILSIARREGINFNVEEL